MQQVARFLPGGAGAGLRVGFSQGHLTVQQRIRAANLPLGAGQITDVAVAMGFEVSLARSTCASSPASAAPTKPFRWVVSPLAGTGVVQVGIGIDGPRHARAVRARLGLAIDLGIAAGSASVALALELNTGPDRSRSG